MTHLCSQWHQLFKAKLLTSQTPSSWSESLQQQTRNAIEQQPITRDGHLYFKHLMWGTAYAELGQLADDPLVLHSKAGLADQLFDDVEALLQAGWAVD